MKHLFSHATIKTIILILSLMLFVKMGWFIVGMLFLSSRGVEYTKNAEIKSLYYRTRFATHKLQEKSEIKVPMSDIRSFKLLGIYNSQDLTVVTISKQDKSSVLVKGDTIDGYRLDSATSTEAIFWRDGKSFRLELIKSKDDSKAQESVRYPTKISTPPKGEDTNSESKGEIIQGDDVTIIDKSILKHYSKNTNDIWKNIGMKEVMDGKDIKGFKVNFVKRKSDFSKLGLRRGDIIKQVNGQELNSYNSAFEVYKNIDSIENLTLTIKRGEEEMELNYEIN